MALDSIPRDYGAFLRDLKDRIRQAQLRTALSVNRELVLLYWRIGRDILERQKLHGWGAKIIDKLAIDLQREFSDMKGFSPRNLKYMRAFAEAYPDDSFVQQVAAQMPWFHICMLMDKVKDPPERGIPVTPYLIPVRLPSGLARGGGAGEWNSGAIEQ